MDHIFEAYKKEIDRQDLKWGKERYHPVVNKLISLGGPEAICYHYGIPTEKEAKEKCERAASRGETAWADIIVEELSEALSETDLTKQRMELVQVAACLTQCIKDLDILIEHNKTNNEDN